VTGWATAVRFPAGAQNFSFRHLVQGREYVVLYLHPPVRLYGVLLS